MIYLLQHEDNIAGELKFNEDYEVSSFTLHNKEILPPYILNEKNITKESFDSWILHKKISSARSNIDTVLEEYKVENTRELFVKNYGLSLVDHYWIKPANENIKWEKINCFENIFSTKMGDILIGDGVKNKEGGLSPESTSLGMLPKRWERRADGIYLIKKGSGPFTQEPFNELIANKIMNNLEIKNVEYKIEWKNGNAQSVCKNFLKKEQELIHAFDFAHIIKEKSDKYKEFLSVCENNNIKNIERNIGQMLVVDYIIGNTDRHFNNFGFLRNTKTLSYEGFAPVYDSGNSLYNNNSENNISIYKDISSKPFKSYHSEQIKELLDIIDYFDKHKLSNISDIINDTLKENNLISEKRRNIIIHCTKRRVENLEQMKN